MHYNIERQLIGFTICFYRRKLSPGAISIAEIMEQCLRGKFSLNHPTLFFSENDKSKKFSYLNAADFRWTAEYGQSNVMLVSVFSNEGTMMKRVIIGIAAAAALMMSNAANAQDWSSEQTEVWDFVTSAWATHNDASTWSEALDPAGYGWSGNYPVPTSREQMAKRNGIFGKEGKVLYYQVDPIKIAVNGDTAIAYYYANIVETNHMKKRENSIERCADTLIKRDGEWRFLGWLCQTKSASDD